MFLFEVKCLIWSALEIQFFELCFLQPVLGGHPVLTGHLAIPWGWPLNTGSTLIWNFAIPSVWLTESCVPNNFTLILDTDKTKKTKKTN